LLSLILRAAESGYLAIVQLLLENGAIWNAEDDARVTVGEYARRAGHGEVYREACLALSLEECDL
jgi:ankyrin repeat protein